MSTIDRAFRPASYWDPAEPARADHLGLAAMRPSWMAGEYLPDYLPGEVEIARVVLESVTQDVVSIRARRRGSERRIVYRVVDEFASEFDFSPRSSRQPLCHDELARLIETLRNTTNPVEGLGYTVESRIYLTLGEHFRAT
jgi:hypothetical protein